MILKAVTLSAEAFAAYGAVIEHRGTDRRTPVEGVFDTTLADARSSIWVSRVSEAASAPVMVRQMERHPYSAQTFIPLAGQPYLIVVCPARADGMPDASRLEAFIAGPTQGVVYRRNTWHHGLTVLAAPAEFVVMQARAPDGGDDVFVPLDAPVSIEFGGSSP